MISYTNAAASKEHHLPGQAQSTPSARTLSSSCPGLTAQFRPGHASKPLAAPARPELPPKEEREQWKYCDAHFHPTDYIQQGYKPLTLIAEMDALGIQYATLMPIPTNVLSSQPDPAWNPCLGEPHCGPRYYLPQQMMGKRTLTKEDMDTARAATELYVNMGVDATTALRYMKLPMSQRHRFDPMITGLHLGDMHSSTYLLQKLAQHPGVFTGVGEITVYKEVVQDLFAGNRQADLGGNAGPLIKLLQTCGNIGMPVVLHCDVDLPGQQGRQTPAYLEAITRLFRHPDVSSTSIIWAHGGGLGRFVNAPEGHTAALRQLLEDNALKHVHIDLSWSVVAERLTQSPQTQAEWVALITDHPGRFLFGSDALAPVDRDTWNKTFASYNGLLMSLPDAVRIKVLQGNYKRLFVDARSKVRAYEKFFLASALRESERSFRAGPVSSLPASAAAGTGAPDSRADSGKEAQATLREEQFTFAATPQPHGSPGALRQ